MMQLNSYFFIFVLLPIVVLGYYFGNKIHITCGKLVLILGSVAFYAYGNITIIIPLLCSILINYIISFWIKMLDSKRLVKKAFFVFAIMLNVAALLYFKYTNFAIANINNWFSKDYPLQQLVLPLGISFYTFQQIAYLLAVYNGEISSNTIIDYLVYILFFPKLLMGPLMDPADFITQINAPAAKKVCWNNIAGGIKIFSFGLFKKMLLADTFNKAVSWGFMNVELATSIDWILVMLFYTMEIYFDFSGYSDMAVGSALMLNIKLPINFDSPYKALSIRDFWKRWHISLTQFFTKSIYIPLGGNRKGALRTCLNTIVVFVISGIWHGANWTFILWGILHGLISLVNRFTDRLRIPRLIKWSATFVVVNILWLLFRADSITQWTQILKGIIAMENVHISEDLFYAFNLQEVSYMAKVSRIVNMCYQKFQGINMVLFIIVSMAVCLIPNNTYKKVENNTFVSMVLAAFAFAWGVLCLGGESVFVYLNF